MTNVNKSGWRKAYCNDRCLTEQAGVKLVCLLNPWILSIALKLKEQKLHLHMEGMKSKLELVLSFLFEWQTIERTLFWIRYENVNVKQ